MPPQKNEPGIYTLIIALPRPEKIVVGSLGAIDFPQGYYSYTGSARGTGGLKRVDRHILVSQGIKKVRRWHIDYLLPKACFLEAFVTKTPLDLECDVARAIGERLTPVPGFGCTDCRCPSHLHHSTDLQGMRDAVSLAHSRQDCSSGRRQDW
jgi:Uri superfamily endonuclease